MRSIMHTWEYCAIQVTGNQTTLQFFRPEGGDTLRLKQGELANCMARLGIEGWELVSASVKDTPANAYGSQHGSQLLYFKRILMPCT